jgi:hypothetical protein
VTAEAKIGLDLRALPVGTPASGIDIFVLAQADRMRELAPPGTDLEFRRVVGTGVLDVIVRADGEAEVICSKIVSEYLEHAPRLPVIRTPAAQLVVPCTLVDSSAGSEDEGAVPPLGD